MYVYNSIKEIAEQIGLIRKIKRRASKVARKEVIINKIKGKGIIDMNNMETKGLFLSF